MAARLRRRSTSARSRIPRSRAAPEEAGRPRIRPIVCGTPPRPAPRTRSGARDGGVTRPALYRATVPMVPGDGRHAARLGAGGAGAARGGHCAAPRGTDRVHGDDARGRPVLPRLARRGTGAGRRPRRGARDRRGRPRHDARGGVEARSPSSPRRSAGPPGCGGLRGGGELSGGDGPRPAPGGAAVRAARGHELWPLAPGPGPRGGGARPARPALSHLHRGLRHARPARGEGAARRARVEALVMRCPSCGHENREGAKFCEECAAPAVTAPERDPRAYTPKHLAEKILSARSALEGERKQVTVLFADVKGSMDLAEQVDPEVFHQVMERFAALLAEGVHRFEGTVTQFTGDGVMALFGAPIAHEDHAQRACYAALHLQEALRRYANELRLSRGLNFAVRMGLNSGEVVVGTIGDDLRMDYTAQGHVVGLAARMEQIAEPGKVYVAEHTARLVTGFFRLADLGPLTVKGVQDPLRVYELEGVGSLRTKLDVSRARGFSRFVGREGETATLEAALARAAAGDAQVVGVVAEAGVGKSRLCYEFVQRCRARRIPVHEAHGAAHGKMVPYLLVFEFLRGYFGIGEQDSAQAMREKIAGKLLLLDPALADTHPSLAGLGERIRTRTGGNPFFIEEIVQALVEAGSLAGTKGAYRLARPVAELTLPTTVQAVLAARIDRLPAREKEVLGTAAVIGKAVPGLILKRVAALPQDELSAAVAELVSREFLYETALYPEAEYAFKHPLTQEVAYRSQLAERRKAVHAAVARAIEGFYADRRGGRGPRAPERELPPGRSVRANLVAVHRPTRARLGPYLGRATARSRRGGRRGRAAVWGRSGGGG